MRKYLNVIIIGLMVLMLAGCGKEISLSINDSDMKTEIIAKTGQTVADVLNEAEISVSDKDKVTPSLESKLTETDTAIVIERMVTLSVIYDGKENNLEMLGGTVAEAIEKAGITLDELDYVDVNLEDKVQNGMTVNISKQAKVVITVAGEATEVITSAKTVSDVLKEQNITVGENDIISCDVNSEITSGMEIVINRVEIKEVTETEEIPFETETQKSNSLAKGKTQIKQEGVNGEKTITYKVTYVDGVEQDKELVSEEVVKEAVKKIVLSGNKAEGKKVVKTEYYDDCDGSGHGYKIVYYSDGSSKRENY